MDALEYQLKHRIMVLSQKVERLQKVLLELISRTVDTETEKNILMKILEEEDEE